MHATLIVMVITEVIIRNMASTKNQLLSSKNNQLDRKLWKKIGLLLFFLSRCSREEEKEEALGGGDYIWPCSLRPGGLAHGPVI